MTNLKFAGASTALVSTLLFASVPGRAGCPSHTDAVPVSLQEALAPFPKVQCVPKGSFGSLDGIALPFNPDFPDAFWPYAQRPDGCSSWNDNPDLVRDTWGPVDFRPACNAHDKCYYDVSHNPLHVEMCNIALEAALRAACEKAASSPEGLIVTIGTGGLTLAGCYGFALGMASLVAITSPAYFPEAQSRQSRYERWARDYVERAKKE